MTVNFLEENGVRLRLLLYDELMLDGIGYVTSIEAERLCCLSTVVYLLLRSGPMVRLDTLSMSLSSK